MPHSGTTERRPHRNLLKLYFVRSLLTGPLIFISLPVLYFRYHTLRYTFDAEGISMRWGILFRRQVNLTYARVQDIHLTSGPLQRWLGLTDIHIQTASGSAAAEMIIEGLLEYEALRDFLYDRMRGARDSGAQASVRTIEATGHESDVAGLLQEIAHDLRATREAVTRLSRRNGDV